jgi:site-specific DNA-methyltransferase (cytosine-N4-specific)
VRFFVDFLTDPGDLVLDPFAGSNVTGAVGEAAGRRWLACDVNPAYVEGSAARFEEEAFHHRGTEDTEKTKKKGKKRKKSVRR